MINAELYINTLKRESLMCHDSSSVFSFITETRYLNFILCMNGDNLLGFFFIVQCVLRYQLLALSSICKIDKCVQK